MKSILYSLVITSLVSPTLYADSNHTSHYTKEGNNISIQEKKSTAHKDQRVVALPTESGQSIFGAIAEINQLLEEGNVDWASVDLDAVMEHLKDMNNLMLSTKVSKTELSNGLAINVSNLNNGQRAMDNMIPAHTDFLRGVRPHWKISNERKGLDYLITVTSEIKTEVIKIKALGFSGLMVQDDHHASHHMGLALKKKNH